MRINIENENFLKTFNSMTMGAQQCEINNTFIIYFSLNLLVHFSFTFAVKRKDFPEVSGTRLLLYIYNNKHNYIKIIAEIGAVRVSMHILREYSFGISS